MKLAENSRIKTDEGKIKDQGEKSVRVVVSVAICAGGLSDSGQDQVARDLRDKLQKKIKIEEEIGEE